MQWGYRMDVEERIIADPAVMGGKPIIRGTRITVELIMRKLCEGMSVDDLVHAYPMLHQEDIYAALHYCARVIDIPFLRFDADEWRKKTE
jgi:uncharacterized protein (DUF433 family)